MKTQEQIEELQDQLLEIFKMHYNHLSTDKKLSLASMMIALRWITEKDTKQIDELVRCYYYKPENN